MRLPGRRRTQGHRALEAAAREIRDAQGTERDEILMARRALRREEKAHDQRVKEAERTLVRARAPEPIAGYGPELIVYDDRVTTPGASHDIARGVHATVRDVDGAAEVELLVEGPDWRQAVRGPCEDADRLREVAEAIERAAAAAPEVIEDRRPAVDAAHRELEQAREDRLHVAEAAPLIHRVGDLCSGEEVLDLAPGLWTGHDGVLVATDRRLMFVGLRASVSLPYAEITSLSPSGRLFGARLNITTATGRATIAGLSPERAAELAELARARIDGAAVAA